MDVNNMAEIEDGDQTRSVTDAPPMFSKQKLDGTVKKKRRRGKSKRKIMKPFMKISWQERRINEKCKRNNRFRKIVMTKTHAPFNNNQFLMEIHKPEPESDFQIPRTPSARTRDSSFSVDSEENYFFSLPKDEDEYLTKEFSSVYEDAQSERLSNMSKDDLIQEYLLLEAKYDNLVKRTERSKPKYVEDDKDTTVEDRDTSITDRDSMLTDRDTSATSIESSIADEPSMDDLLQRMKEQENQIRELQLANDKLRLENEHLRRSHDSSSEDSESDSSSTSVSNSSSCHSSNAVINESVLETNNDVSNQSNVAASDQNGITDDVESINPLHNGFHNSVTNHSNDTSDALHNERS